MRVFLFSCCALPQGALIREKGIPRSWWEVEPAIVGVLQRNSAGRMCVHRGKKRFSFTTWVVQEDGRAKPGLDHELGPEAGLSLEPETAQVAAERCILEQAPGPACALVT